MIVYHVTSLKKLDGHLNQARVLRSDLPFENFH